MVAVLRHWREMLLYLSVFCTLLFGIAAARAKPSINLYVVNKEGLLSEDSAWSGPIATAEAATAPTEAATETVSDGPGAAARDEQLTDSLADPVQKVDIDLVAVLNGYDATELQAISGIGPALANRIVEYRESIGGFESLDELLEVSGIGAVKLSQIESHLNQLFGR
jgi:competence protein ComEA